MLMLSRYWWMIALRGLLLLLFGLASPEGLESAAADARDQAIGRWTGRRRRNPRDRVAVQARKVDGAELQALGPVDDHQPHRVEVLRCRRQLAEIAIVAETHKSANAI